MKIKKIVKKAIRKALAGFSLVEMLIVIAVIGVITAIAVPAISSITSEAETAKVARNAQNIASVYNAAVAAGASLSTDSKTTAITSLQSGVNGSGSFSGATFLVDIDGTAGNNETEAGKAADAISLTNGIMTF
ncbi:MAG: prepilin-type N-terminal cleavage/methylation domain-containing protein [Verrucomicrobiales bacterium]|nr:prepilin-type N-terminal cleavage/methylation domain-containing protein [Verrucomicrobiales bacterium]